MRLLRYALKHTYATALQPQQKQSKRLWAVGLLAQRTPLASDLR
jgi:hypothetical protein